jgi:hypothetical protein
VLVPVGGHERGKGVFILNGGADFAGASFALP